MSNASIRITGLTKRYGGAVVVDDVSLDIGAGEFLTLLGLSGSGKSTTLMAIAGFVQPDEGTVAISGTDVTDWSPEQRELGVVFQSYALFPHLDVFDNIAFPLRMRRFDHARIAAEVDRVLTLVSMKDLGRRRISQLSGGQQQRVALARALVFSPRVLLMDEPLGALDRQLREQMQIEIRRIHQQLGVTVVYVTHDQEEALSMSDRIAIMAHGRIQQLGTPSDIYLRPDNRFVAGFFGESNFLDVVVEQGPAGMVLRPKSGGDIVLRTASAGPMSGSDHCAMVRPEAVVIGEAPDPAFENNLPGTVERLDFLGATVRVTVRTAAGPIAVRTERFAAAACLRPGSSIWLKWRSHETALFDAAS